MTEFRKNLLSRMIHIYGFENDITIKYAHMLEKALPTVENNRKLEIIVEYHEQYPQF